MENNTSKQTDPTAYSPMNSNPKKDYSVYVIIVVVIILIVIAVILLLLNRNNIDNLNSSSTNNTTDTTTKTNTNSNTNSNVVSQPVTHQNSDSNNSSNTDNANQLASENVVYNSTNVTVDGVEYVSFDHCDTALSVCYHYLLSNTSVAAFPILDSAINTQPFLISGKYINSPGGNAAGNIYYVLTDDVIVEVVATYVDKEVDPDNSTTNNYVFSSCANPAPPCNKYLVKESFISGISFVQGLTAGDEVAFSGEVSDGGGAAGTHYWKMKTITIEKL